MGGNEQKPIIRFRGFTDSWEQRKLSSIAEEVTRTEPESTAPVMMITANNGFIEQSDRYAFNNAGESLKKYILLEKGEMAYNHGASKLRPYGSCFALTTAENARIPFVYHCFSVGENDPEFVSMELNGARVESQLRRIVSSGARMDGLLNISYEEYSGVELMMPSVAEQKKLADYFRQIDNLITLHQREHDILVNVKKSMLERLFPREGSNVPEIRFAGFNNAWTKHKVTELGDIYIGLVTTMTSHYTDHGTLLIRNSDIKDGRFQFGSNPIYLDDDFAKQNTSRKHRVGDVITVHTGDIGTSAVITEKEAGSIGFATIVTRPDKGKITSEFLCTYLNTDAHKNFAMNISTGDGRNNYNLKDYYECIIPLPCIEEQKKISSFVSGLNRLINTHQHKLEKLQSIKASMLERMFV